MKGVQYMFPASFAQQRLWILDQMVPGNAFYNLSAPIRLRFPVNSLVLKKSLNEIVQRHETLRTTFTAIDGQPHQLIAASHELELVYHDLSNLRDAQRDAEAQRLITADARTPFNLSEGPLLRTTLIKFGSEDFIFLLSMHHIISDGWSRFIFFRELTALYDCFVQGKPSNLPELPIQYADFAVWQRDYLTGDVLKERIDFWTEQLKDMQVLNLPTDKPRPALQSFAGSFELMEFTAEASQTIRNVGQQYNTTLFMTLLAGFIALLQRYTQQDDITVGVPVANRNQTEIEHLIGFFVNSIVIRTDLSGVTTFAALLQQVKTITLEAYKHEDLPFEMLVEAIQPERDLSRNPLFQVSFQFLQFPKISGATSDTGSPFVGIDKGTSIFDLRVSFAEHDGRIGGEIEYSTELFEASTIRKMAGHFVEFMTKASSEPDQNLNIIDIVRTEEKQQLLETWNNTATAHQAYPLLHRLFETQAELTPGSAAVMFRNKQLSFQDLNTRSNQLARYLKAHGVQEGCLVGVCLNRSEWIIISFLAILKAGASYIPLDPAYPSERLQVMMDDAKAYALICETATLEKFSKLPALVVMPNIESEQISIETGENLYTDIHPLSTAYVIYTSGSTGKPKGVMISHSAICNHMLWMKDKFPLNTEDVVMQRTTYNFDASVWEFYAPLITGAKLFIADEGNRDPDYLIEMISQHSITVLQLVPSLLKLLVSNRHFSRCTSLKRVFCGGEPLAPALIVSFYRQSNAALLNLYGPTEATIDASSWECRIEQDRERASIGKPIDNVRFYVLDKYMNLVPTGVSGELWISGDGLANGYIEESALTAEKFVPNPLSGIEGERMYRTGDLVRYRTDGMLEYLERVDHQVKLRGFRIEPGDIETSIRSNDLVKDALVLVRGGANDQQLLTAYIVPVNDAASISSSTLAAVLNEYLTERLPEYMIPGAYIVIDAIPLKANGKIDLLGLPQPEWRVGADVQVYAPPATYCETALTPIWENLLQQQKIGIHDHFFNTLGGNSLLAMQLMSRIRAQFSVSLPLTAIFKAPTIHKLGKLVQEQLANEPQPA